MLSTFLPFYLLPPVTKFRGVFGGRKLFLPGHLGFIFDGRVETCFYCEVSYGPLVGCVIGGVSESQTFSKKSNTIGFQICPRDARPNRSTPDLSGPCEVDAGFRVCRPRRCLLCARRFSAGSARFDAPTVLRPSKMRALRCGSGKRKT